MTPVLIAVGALVLVSAGAALVLARCYHRVAADQALVISKPGGSRVAFGGALVVPVIQRADTISMAVHCLEVDRRGADGIICRDNLRADVTMRFFVRVNPTSEDILKVAQSVGCERASDPVTLTDLFTAKFSEAAKTVAKQLDYDELHTRRDELRDRILEVVGRDLNGFVLDDLTIDALEQTPLEQLDPGNILDAQGIKKILTIQAEAEQAQRAARGPVTSAVSWEAPAALVAALPEPAPARTASFEADGQTVRLVESPPRLELLADEVVVCALRLDRPLEGSLHATGASPPGLGVVLRQRGAGVEVELTLAGPASAVLGSRLTEQELGARLEARPTLDGAAVTLSGFDLSRVVAAVRHAMAGAERWS